MPSTKRKAQNRAAQRAFRERRANRVNELEQQLMNLEREKSVKEGLLTNTIETLKRENANLQQMIDNLRQTTTNLNSQVTNLTEQNRLQANQLNQARCTAQRAQRAQERRRRSLPGSNISRQKNLAAGPSRKQRKISPLYDGSPRNSSSQSSSPRSSISRISDLPVSSTSSGDSVNGKCPSLKARVLDVEAASAMLRFKNSGSTSGTNSVCPSRSGSSGDLPAFKPMAAVPLHRNELSEQDFTSEFKTEKPRKMPVLAPTTESSSSVASPGPVSYEDSVISPDEKCGFCQEGTPCLCREIAMERRRKQHDREIQTSLPRLVPSTYSASTMTKNRLDSVDKKVSQCTGNPGTCPQCQKDRRSSLFCTSIAKTVENSNDTSTKLPSLRALELRNPGKHYMPCADAYKTLSQHANFRKVRISNLVNNLNTRGMFVEVESINKCLHKLDSRFANN